MLILTRRPGESVMIGEEVVLTVLGVIGNQVRIGIQAPKEIPIHREEIYDRIKRELAQSQGLLPETNGNTAEEDEPFPPARVPDPPVERGPIISARRRVEAGLMGRAPEDADAGVSTGRKTLKLRVVT